MLFLGLDIGSSSAKVSIVDGDTGQCLGATHYPDTELEIMSPNAGWAEQHPEIWWDSIRHGLRRLCATASIDPKAIDAIGISYQMHGLVLVDAKQQVLRPAIIWCDSRAIPAGEEAFQALGADHCFGHLLNSPGNFTASKLRWVQQNQPDIFAQVHKFMLPGDYIAICFVPTGDYRTLIDRLRPQGREAGEIVHLDGRVLGTHAGITDYTIGQASAGLGIGAGLIGAGIGAVVGAIVAPEQRWKSFRFVAH